MEEPTHPPNPLTKPPNGVSEGGKTNGSTGHESGDHEEHQYLNLVRRIIETGEVLSDLQ